MARDAIAGMLGEAGKALEAEHGALRTEIKSGLEGLKKKALSGA